LMRYHRLRGNQKQASIMRERWRALREE